MFGGKVCSYLWSLGIATLVPISINIFFNLLVYLEDLLLGSATKLELLFVPLACYPQVKCIKFLFRYLLYKDENRLEEDKKSYEDRLGSLEPFLEAAFQVRIDFNVEHETNGYHYT